MLGLVALALVFGACGDEPADGDDAAVDPQVDAAPAIDAGLPIDAPPPVCGDEICEPPETSASCAGDCPVCGDDVCAGDEPATCAADCPTTATLVVRNNSSYSIWSLYLAPCGGDWSTDQLGEMIINTNGQFTLAGILPGCWQFRAETSPGVGLSWQTATGVTLVAGQTYPWTLTN